MVDLVRLQFIKQLYQIHRIGQVTVMEKQPDAVDVRVGVKMVDARGVEGAGPPDDAVDFVPLLEKQIGQITAILPGDSGDQCFCHLFAIINDASAACCAAINSPIPFFASASICASSSLEKVASSPEPCISTNSPASVATRLKSTVTALSSS